MRFATFVPPGKEQERLGVVSGERVLDLAAASGGRIPSTMRAFLERSDELLPAARELLGSAPPSGFLPLASVRLRPVLPDPASLRDFFAFEDHAKAAAERRGEPLGKSWYEVPAYFKGNPREIYGPEDEVPWPWFTRRLDFECEVACVVGRRGRDLSPEEAASHLFGYMLFNDFSARDIQKKEMANLMGPGKAKDFANAFGPFLVTADEADPRRDFAMTVRLNGRTVSEGHFRDQYWGFPLMLSHASQCETLHPGDVLGSGTFHKGCGLDLGLWLRPGDVIELEVPVLGVLRNRVGAPKEQRELNYLKSGHRP
ncbi:MAG TPA: fumarylacetoacetase [Elusimicrobia bacterium]|nr:fumarylacetoacetase [Elusimicrobiota bacterium]